MKTEEFHKMAAVEDTMWYYRALHGIVGAELATALGGKPGAAVLDAGCGTGGLLRRLRAAHAGWACTGLDLSPIACELARARVAGARVVEGSIEALPFPEASFDAVVSCDALCQVENPGAATAELARCLRPGGVAVLTFPAYQWFYSYHDEQVGNRRRHARRGAEELVRAAGLRVERSSYWNTVLFPLVVLRRKLLPAEREASDVQVFPAPLEAMCHGVLAVERAWLRRGWPLPFGCALFVVARKPA